MQERQSIQVNHGFILRRLFGGALLSLGWELPLEVVVHLLSPATGHEEICLEDSTEMSHVVHQQVYKQTILLLETFRSFHRRKCPTSSRHYDLN